MAGDTGEPPQGDGADSADDTGADRGTDNGQQATDGGTTGEQQPETPETANAGPAAGGGPPPDGQGVPDAGDGADDTDNVDRCDYCRLPLSAGAVELQNDGDTYSFCSERCRDAVDDADSVFTKYHGFRRTPTGVGPIDESLPQGLPRNSFVMLTDLAGTRTEAIRAELVWRALERGEPALVVSFLEPPVSIIQEFVTLDWNVLPYLESGQLQFVDAFTYRMEDSDRMNEHFNPWNTHLEGFASAATSRVRDPSDTSELQSRIDDVLESQQMEDQGIVVVDSLNEFGSLVQPVQAYRFLKDLRAAVCKSRFVPVYASATVTGDGQGFPHDLSYMVDGIVELQLNDDLVEGSLMKQIRVRKMAGVLNLPKWVLYEYTAGEGIVTIQVHQGPTGDGDSEAFQGSQESGESDGSPESEQSGDPPHDSQTHEQPQGDETGGVPSQGTGSADQAGDPSR